MPSEVQNPDIAAAITAAATGIAALLNTGVRPENARDAITMIREIEQLHRATDALAVNVLTEIDDNRWHLADGHASPKTMVRHIARLSTSEAQRRDRISKTAKTLPDVWDAYQQGTVGSDHMTSIATVHANPRVRHAMPARQTAILNEAHASHDTFDQRLQQWKRLTDEDGPTPPNQRHHEDRNARVDQDYDLAFHAVASLACEQGLQIKEIFDHYVQAETLADWEKARAEHGENATKDHLPRTIQQRRADAFWQIFIDAAANPNSAVPADFVHNIVWDATTFEQLATKILGEDAGFDTTGQDLSEHGHQTTCCDSNYDDSVEDDVDVEDNVDVEASLFDGIDPDHMVCRTIDGIDLEPTEMMINAITATIRRVVFDAPSEKVDLGKKRSFTGMARHAIKLKATHCIWPGCTVPSSDCESDHLIEHSKGGRTYPGNGAPLCGRHNRHKQAGYTIFRTPDGQWHILRPDRTRLPT